MVATAKRAMQGNVLDERILALSRLVVDLERLVVFTSPDIHPLVADLWIAGVPAIPLRMPFDKALQEFERLESGILVAGKQHWCGWRARARVVVFVDMLIDRNGALMRQQMARIKSAADPIFINCRFVGELTN
jgi:hypothetical protein